MVGGWLVVRSRPSRLIVMVPERGEPGNVGRVDRIAVRGEVVEGSLDEDGLPEHDDVDHDAERYL